MERQLNEIERKEQEKLVRLDLPIVGMTCASCVQRVQSRLISFPGVKHANVNLATEKATVELDLGRVKMYDLVKFIKAIGYDIAVQKITIPIEGASYSASPSKIEKIIQNITGVVKTNVNIATEEAVVEFIPTIITIDEIKRELEKAGYKVPELKEEDVETFEEILKQREYNDLRRRFTVAAILTGIILIDMVSHFTHLFTSRTIVNYILFALTTPVIFYSGKKFFKSFWTGLKHMSADMNTLVAIGTGSAYIYSVTATFLPEIFVASGKKPDVYYETSAVIITLILLGKLLEARAKSKTTEAIRKLSSLRPKTATLVKNGEEIRVPIKEVKVGDILLVKPGERIPLDGEIIEGYASVDESIITGESLPVEKKPGDTVIGSTINKAGSFKFKVKSIGKDTLLSQIIQMVREAQGSKAPIQRIADKVASIFVPVVIIIAFITFITWYLLGFSFTFALMNFVAVLIVACPCALGLATPTAIVVSTGKAAENGILIKNGESLELMHRVSAIVFDKTGTITHGRPEVTDIITLDSMSEDELLRLSASVERNSEHPIAEAIIRYARLRNLKLVEPKNFISIQGQGVYAEINSRRVAVGNITFIKNLNIDTKKYENKLEILANEGKTPMFVAVDGKLAGIIAVADTIKPSVKETIHRIKEFGIDVFILTGDNSRTAKAIADKIGVEKFMAEVLPEQKTEKIKELQSKGIIVAMVGDGINDAPALAQADVGIAIGSGTDVANATADIILLRDDIKGVLQAIKLSSRTMKTIKQNLFWAFFYNIILIPVASGILYPAFKLLLKPVLASFAMAFSSVFVVSNSLRIRKFKI